jgi:hypothetical protein
MLTLSTNLRNFTMMGPCSGDRLRPDADAPAVLFKFYKTVGHGKHCVIATNLCMVARLNAGSALTDHDGTARHKLSVSNLDAQSLALTVSSVTP